MVRPNMDPAARGINAVVVVVRAERMSTAALRPVGPVHLAERFGRSTPSSGAKPQVGGSTPVNRRPRGRSKAIRPSARECSMPSRSWPEAVPQR